MAKNGFYWELDKKDVRMLLRDLDRLDKQVTKNQVMRRVLKKAGRPIMKLIKKYNRTAFRGGKRMSRTFKFKQNTFKKAFVTVWIQSDVAAGDGIGRMTTWFEEGTDERTQVTTGQRTGKIDSGPAKTYQGVMDLKFIQRGFDNKKKEAVQIILKSMTEEVDKAVRASKTLVKGN